jgi:hypothetical protein
MPYVIKRIVGSYNKHLMSTEMNHKPFNIYFSTNSILYIDSDGELKRMYCPFSVIAKVDILPILEGDVVTVDAVKITPDGRDVYIINDKGYYVIYFRLI